MWHLCRRLKTPESIRDLSETLLSLWHCRGINVLMAVISTLLKANPHSWFVFFSLTAACPTLSLCPRCLVSRNSRINTTCCLKIKRFYQRTCLQFHLLTSKTKHFEDAVKQNIRRVRKPEKKDVVAQNNGSIPTISVDDNNAHMYGKSSTSVPVSNMFICITIETSIVRNEMHQKRNTKQPKDCWISVHCCVRLEMLCCVPRCKTTLLVTCHSVITISIHLKVWHHAITAEHPVMCVLNAWVTLVHFVGPDLGVCDSPNNRNDVHILRKCFLG